MVDVALPQTDGVPELVRAGDLPIREGYVRGLIHRGGLRADVLSDGSSRRAP